MGGLFKCNIDHDGIGWLQARLVWSVGLVSKFEAATETEVWIASTGAGQHGGFCCYQIRSTQYTVNSIRYRSKPNHNRNNSNNKNRNRNNTELSSTVARITGQQSFSPGWERGQRVGMIMVYWHIMTAKHSTLAEESGRRAERGASTHCGTVGQWDSRTVGQ